MNEAKTDNKISLLPLSIKLIGLFYIIFIPIIVVAFTYSIAIIEIGLDLDISATSSERDQTRVRWITMGALVSLAPLLVGVGLFRRNKIAWYSAIVLSVLVSLSIIPAGVSYLGIIVILIGLIILWKLWEHRKIFGI